jgi:hypothetical protein
MLGRRDHKGTIDIAPQRMPVPISAKEAFLCGLPGIGIERSRAILSWAGSLAYALSGLTDLSVTAPVGDVVRRHIRKFLGLAEQQSLDFMFDDNNKEILMIKEKTNV